VKLLLVFDHRFRRAPSGIIWSEKSYTHAFFATRYLGVFEQIDVLARVEDDPKDAIVEGTEGPGVRVVPVGDWRGPSGFLRGRRTITALLRRHLDADTAVIMIVPGMLPTLAVRVLGRRPFGVEVVGDPYDSMAPGAMRHPLRPLIRAFAVRSLRSHCARAAAALYVTRSALQRRYPCPAYVEGVSDVELDAAAFSPVPRVFSDGPGSRALVTVGTMEQLYKGYDTLLDALALCTGAGADVRLVLVGEGRYRPELMRRAGRLGLDDRVRFTGRLPHGAAIRAELDAADVFVLPSRQEGLPRAMVEAMARALPCIGSDVGGIPELLTPDVLVPPGDARALATKIRELCGDGPRLSRLSERNLEESRQYASTTTGARRRAFYANFRAIVERSRTDRPSLRSRT